MFNTTITLYQNVPLDNEYTHTFYPATMEKQRADFANYAYTTKNAYSYVRENRNYMRVEMAMRDTLFCNYLSFCNLSNEAKYFYAFITERNYINENTVELGYEIDIFQTYRFNSELGTCFVEREHAETDEIGDNIVPEDVFLGEYVFNGYGRLTNTLDPLGVMIMICDNDEAPDGTLYDGIYGGCSLFCYPYDQIENIKAKVNSYVQKPDAIVAMYMCPLIAPGSVVPAEGLKLEYSEGATILNISQDPPTKGMEIDHYIPNNAKMYTYPYNYLCIGNGKTTSAYRYEYFLDLTPTFEIEVPVTMPIQVALRPKRYKNSGDLTLNSETMILDDYPMCSWSTDAFKAWLAQNALPIATTLGTLGAQTAGSIMTGTPMVNPESAANQIGSIISQGYQASIQADISKGSLCSGNINVASGKQTFWGGRCSISKTQAQIIDSYWDMFGYATRRVKRPNMNGRPHWNYVKTVNAMMSGNVPADALSRMQGYFNKGITLWKNLSEVGNYGLDNRI